MTRHAEIQKLKNHRPRMVWKYSLLLSAIFCSVCAVAGMIISVYVLTTTPNVNDIAVPGAGSSQRLVDKEFYLFEPNLFMAVFAAVLVYYAITWNSFYAKGHDALQRYAFVFPSMARLKPHLLMAVVVSLLCIAAASNLWNLIQRSMIVMKQSI